MFHRLPLSALAVLSLAVLVGLAALFSPSFSPPGSVHADHPSLPTVSIVDITPEVAEEGGHVRVTVRLSRPLTDDEKFCYPGKKADEDPKDEVCIQGGIWGKDSYNDHSSKDGDILSDEDFAFVFRRSETEKRMTLRIAEDGCITPGRTMRISINSHYRSDTYGYNIDTTEHTVRIAGDDTTNGDTVDNEGECKPESTDGRREGWANWDEGAYKGESLGSIGTV